MKQTVSILVKGKVQGVFYRQSTKEKAVQLGLTGFVQNLPNGDVYIETTGSAEQVEALSAWCHQGPSRAVVTTVQVVPLEDKTFDAFVVQR